MHNFLIRPGGGKGALVLEVARRETIHVREGVAPAGRQPVDDLGAVVLLGLLVQDALANVPIEHEHRADAGQHQPQTLAMDADLDLGQSGRVVGGHVGGRRGNQKHGATVDSAALLTLHSCWPGFARGGFLRGVMAKYARTRIVPARLRKTVWHGQKQIAPALSFH
ncbi:MAG: hypothetical protein ABI478_01830 [Propionivibrio sp.]